MIITIIINVGGYIGVYSTSVLSNSGISELLCLHAVKWRLSYNVLFSTSPELCILA